MSGRAGRGRFLLHPTRPRYLRKAPKAAHLVYAKPSTLTVAWSFTNNAFVRQPTIQAGDAIQIQTSFLGNARVIPGPLALPAALDLRVAAGVTIAPTTPAIIGGKPVVPDHWAKPDSSSSASTVYMIPDPDPVVTPPVGGSNPHPNGIAPTYTWHVTDLGLGSLSSWVPHGGSGPAWTSSGTYRPVVRQTVVYGAGSRYHTYTKGVHFDGADVQHMWLDLGSTINQPFSFVICALIHYYPTRTYGHYLLDAGKATPSKYADDRDHQFNEGLSYRSLMLFQSHNAILATHTGADAVANGKHVITRADFAPRPKMFFGIFNGSNSYIGAWDNRNHFIQRGTIDVKSPRYFVTGRRQNNVSDNLASHMTMFEMRMFTSAISRTTLDAIYKQMAATWKFNNYHV